VGPGLCRRGPGFVSTWARVCVDVGPGLQPGQYGLARGAVESDLGRLQARPHVPAVPPGADKSHLWSLGRDRVLGGLVRDALWASGAGWPNGPPSPRLAPGGFYASPRAEYGFARGGPVPEEPALLAKRRQGCRERASIERAESRMLVASVRRDGTGPPRAWVVVIADWAGWWWTRGASLGIDCRGRCP